MVLAAIRTVFVLFSYPHLVESLKPEPSVGDCRALKPELPPCDTQNLSSTGGFKLKGGWIGRVALKTSPAGVENYLAMAHQTAPVCFTCGLAYDRLHFNRLRNGAVCPTCRDRLLDELPSILPSRAPQQVNEEMPVEASGSLLRALPRLGNGVGDQERL